LNQVVSIKKYRPYNN